MLLVTRIRSTVGFTSKPNDVPESVKAPADPTCVAAPVVVLIVYSLLVLPSA
jgi:hypothetical protein